MPTGTWALGWAVGDVVTAAEFSKTGCIFDQTLSGLTASFDITGIVGAYAHLKIEAYLRSDTAAQGTAFVLRFNADSGANYGWQYVRGTGSGPTSSSSIADTSITSAGAAVPAASATANGFGALEVTIPHYANTANHKAALYSSINASTTSATTNEAFAGGGVWRNTAAINRITLSPAAGQWVSGSRLSIYVMGS
jgi:hypothetical protein